MVFGCRLLWPDGSGAGARGRFERPSVGKEEGDATRKKTNSLTTAPEEISSPYAKIIAYRESSESLLSDFFIFCLQLFGIIRTPKEIIDRNIEIVSYAFK